MGQFLQITSTSLELVFLGSRITLPRSDSHLFGVTQKDLEEIYLLSHEILRAVQNSEILVRPNPFLLLVAYKVFAESMMGLLFCVENCLQIFLISSIFCLGKFGKIAALWVNYGSIRVLITQICQKIPIPPMFCHFLHFFTAFSKL